MISCCQIGCQNIAAGFRTGHPDRFPTIDAVYKFIGASALFDIHGYRGAGEDHFKPRLEIELYASAAEHFPSAVIRDLVLRHFETLFSSRR